MDAPQEIGWQSTRRPTQMGQAVEPTSDTIAHAFVLLRDKLSSLRQHRASLLREAARLEAEAQNTKTTAAGTLLIIADLEHAIRKLGGNPETPPAPAEERY